MLELGARLALWGFRLQRNKMSPFQTCDLLLYITINSTISLLLQSLGYITIPISLTSITTTIKITFRHHFQRYNKLNCNHIFSI